MKPGRDGISQIVGSLGQLDRISEISDSEAGLKVEVRGVIEEEGECGDADVELLARERRSLDILSVKKEGRLFVTAVAEVEAGIEVKKIYDVRVCL